MGTAAILKIDISPYLSLHWTDYEFDRTYFLLQRLSSSLIFHNASCNCFILMLQPSKHGYKHSNKVQTRAVKQCKLHHGQNLIPDSNLDFRINTDRSVCQITPKMYWIHYLIDTSHFAKYRKNDREKW